MPMSNSMSVNLCDASAGTGSYLIPFQSLPKRCGLGHSEKGHCLPTHHRSQFPMRTLRSQAYRVNRKTWRLGSGDKSHRRTGRLSLA